MGKHISLHRQSAFTLIELLIAVGILTMLALATGAMFNSVKSSNERSEVALSSLQDAQRAMLILERDFLQMVERAPRIQGGTNQTIVSGGEFEFESDEGSIAFVRNGWHNPQMILPRSSLQRVVYSLQEQVLIREHYIHVDAVIGAQSKQRELLKDISDFEVFAAFNYEGDDLDWSNEFSGQTLPIAVRISIQSEIFGNLERIFQVAP